MKCTKVSKNERKVKSMPMLQLHNAIYNSDQTLLIGNSYENKFVECWPRVIKKSRCTVHTVSRWRHTRSAG